MPAESGFLHMRISSPEAVERAVERAVEKGVEEVVYLKTKPREHQKWTQSVRFTPRGAGKGSISMVLMILMILMQNV